MWEHEKCGIDIRIWEEKRKGGLGDVKLGSEEFDGKNRKLTRRNHKKQGWWDKNPKNKEDEKK